MNDKKQQNHLSSEYDRSDRNLGGRSEQGGSLEHRPAPLCAGERDNDWDRDYGQESLDFGGAGLGCGGQGSDAPEDIQDGRADSASSSSSSTRSS